MDCHPEVERCRSDRGHPPNESAGYFEIRPNVAGGIGENTVLDRSVHLNRDQASLCGGEVVQ